MLRCAITDLLAQGLDNRPAREARLRTQLRQWTVDRVDIVQLREKRLESGEQLHLTLVALEEIGASHTRLLINSRADVAAAAGAHGVHLTSRPGELTPAQARHIFTSAGRRECVVSLSCHTHEDILRARQGNADFILFSPVFAKPVPDGPDLPGTGLDRLAEACAIAEHIPVLALGGVTAENADSCLAAGASGVAGIRLFAGM